MTSLWTADGRIRASVLWARITNPPKKPIAKSGKWKQVKYASAVAALCKLLDGVPLDELSKEERKRLLNCCGLATGKIEAKGGRLILTCGRERAELDLWDVMMAHTQYPLLPFKPTPQSAPIGQQEIQL